MNKKFIGYYLPKVGTPFHSGRDMPLVCEEYDRDLYRFRSEIDTFFILKKELKNYKKCPHSLIQERVDDLERKLDLYR